MQVNSSVPFIQMEKIEFGYKRSQRIIPGVSGSFWCHHCTAIVGANGSGKTTLGKLLAGILKPWSGKVWIQKETTTQLRLGQIGQRVGYVFQEPDRQLFAPSVREELLFVARLQGMLDSAVEGKAQQMLAEFGLDHVADSFPHALSRGEKQRLALAAVLMQEPGFLILDEPTTGLDKERRQQLTEHVQTLKAAGVGFVIISHDDRFVNNNADRVLTMSGGEIVDDSHP